MPKGKLKNKEEIMKKMVLVLLTLFVSTILTLSFGLEAKAQNIKLPAPKLDGTVSVEKALSERRSVRAYKNEPLTLAEVSQILWAAQGITEPSKGLRTAPSPKSVYLLETYVLPGNVTGLPMGLYKYQPKGHELIKIADGNKKEDLFKAAGQAPIKNAPLAIVFAWNAEKSNNQNWACNEVGHAAENVYLQAVSLDLGTVSMAGFKPDEVKKALNLPDKEQPLYIMPVGKK
jgi:SagB-type dehydrogenase family enzyme